MKDVYLSIGTNMGDRYDNLQQAIALLKQEKAIELVRISSVYETSLLLVIQTKRIF